jgi:hypothetical protein
MQVQKIWELKIDSEVKSFNGSSSFTLQLTKESLRLAEQMAVQLKQLGSSYFLYHDVDKSHLIKEYDFPFTLYFELLIKDTSFIKITDVEELYRRRGYYFPLDISKGTTEVVVSDTKMVEKISVSEALSKVMTNGTYTILNDSKMVEFEASKPYSGRFGDYLEEAYGTYFLTNDESDEVKRIAYLPDLVPNVFGVFSLKVSSLKLADVTQVTLKLNARSIHLRYTFTFRNPIEEFNCSFHTKSAKFEMTNVGNVKLANGLTGYIFESKEAISLSEIEETEPFYIRPQVTLLNAGLDEYQLPEKVYLPKIDKSRIKSDQGRYYADVYVNL